MTRIQEQMTPLVKILVLHFLVIVGAGCASQRPDSEGTNPSQMDEMQEATRSWDSTAAAKVAVHFDIAQHCDALNMRSYIDLYFVAKGHALAGDIDTAYYFLNKAIEIGWTNIDLVLCDEAFGGLYASMVDSLSSQIEQSKFRNKVYDQALDSLFDEDQKFRMMLADSIVPQYGARSSEAFALYGQQRRKDSVHQLIVVDMIRDCGFLGTSVVSGQSALTAYLILQHADAEVHRDHLSVLVRAGYVGEINLEWLGSYYDRILMREGKSQIFGTQRRGYTNSSGEYVMSTWHLAEPDKVDEYRQAFGMGSLAEYMKAANCTEIDTVLNKYP